MRRILYLATYVVLTVVLALSGFILFLQITSWHPAPVEELYKTQKPPRPLPGEFSIFTWNIGYAGLGREMDFFYEGGKQVRPEKSEVSRYLSGIGGVLEKYDTADFIFIQETDRYAKRSYYLDELEKLSSLLKNHRVFFAKNYDSRFVPVPLKEPMGRVVSGLAAFSREEPEYVSRIDFRTRFSWPKQLVMLQRGFILMRYRLENGKQLVLINTHNSVFDEDGSLRRKEIKMLLDTMNSERNKGNYVIAGGDWNMNPPVKDKSWLNNHDHKMRRYLPETNPELFKNWQVVFDPSAPTNRDVNIAYSMDKTTTTILDFFIISPGIVVEQIKTLPLEFQFSDHNPVYLKVTIPSL